jgi:hypothetical protein
VLGMAAFWPLFNAFQWFGVNIATLEQLSRTDPFGLRILPAALMFLRPAVAAIAAVIALYTAWSVAASSTLRPSRVFLTLALTQAVFGLILVVSGPSVNATLTRQLPMFEDHRTPGAVVRPSHFVPLQEAASRSIVRELFGIALGCAVAAVLVRRLALNGERGAASGAAARL